MPIYEFKCNLCQTIFEKLMKYGNKGPVICPACGSDKIVKVISGFSSPGNKTGSGCASCSGKNCHSCH